MAVLQGHWLDRLIGWYVRYSPHHPYWGVELQQDDNRGRSGKTTSATWMHTDFRVVGAGFLSGWCELNLAVTMSSECNAQQVIYLTLPEITR